MWSRSLLVGSLVFLLPALARAETYVVAEGGDDGASGLVGSPWATLQHAADSVGPGDTVLVEPGEYAGFNMTRSGTMGAPITFSAPGGATIISENTGSALLAAVAWALGALRRSRKKSRDAS